MKKFFLLCFFLLSAVSFAAPGYMTVAVISIDALHPDAVQRKYAPNIFRLIDGGFYSPLGQSTLPPLTLIAHTSMVTGLTPDQSDKKDNNWSEGNPVTDKPTLMSSAKAAGYETALIYSKKKLGYLNSGADIALFSSQDAIDRAAEWVADGKHQFLFLHVSGLDTEGPISGWLSAEYMDEFSFIDEQLGVLINKIQQKGSALIIITSDHAGHDKLHGTDDPEDAKRPLVIWASDEKIDAVPMDVLKIENLKKYIESKM